MSGGEKPGLLREVTVDEQKRALMQAMIVAPVRALDLIKRVPPLMKERGWPADQMSCSFVMIAVGATKLGAGGQQLPVPMPLATHDDWLVMAMTAMYPTKPTASEIVVRMDLSRLLEPA